MDSPKIALFLITASTVCVSIQLSSEKLLIRHILHQYEQVTPHGRPVINQSHAVQVRFGLGLIQMELDERSKALSMSLWAKYIWVDEYLTWEPIDFHNITVIKLASALIWLPDIMLYNTAETEQSSRDTLATVFYNGTVLWVPHQKLKSSCSIDVTNFPFDNQQCHMWFGSWTYTTSDINLTMAFSGGIDLSTFHSDFKDTSQWAISRTVAERKVLPSEEEDPNYSVLTYTLELKRNLVFASYILTLPCVFLACLTLVVFWLPPDRPDRTALAMSIFASFLLLLLILVEAAPPTATSVPLLGIYYCFNMVIIMLAVFLSSLVVNVCQMGETGKPLPDWLRKVALRGPVNTICLSNMCPTAFFHEKRRDQSIQLSNTGRPHHHQVGRSNGEGVQSPLLATKFRLFGRSRENGSTKTRSNSVRSCHFSSDCMNNNGNTGPNTQETFASDNRVKTDPVSNGLSFATPYTTIAENIAYMTQALHQLERCISERAGQDLSRRRMRRDWKNVALVLDRIFFVVYVIIIVSSVSILFPRP